MKAHTWEILRAVTSPPTSGAATTALALKCDEAWSLTHRDGAGNDEASAAAQYFLLARTGIRAAGTRGANAAASGTGAGAFTWPFGSPQSVPVVAVPGVTFRLRSSIPVHCSGPTVAANIAIVASLQDLVVNVRMRYAADGDMNCCGGTQKVQAARSE